MSAGTLHAGVDEPVAVRQLRQRVCGDKPAYARAKAEHLRGLGVWVSPHRCAFCHCWHFGPPPSMRTVEALARVIRGLDP